MLRSILMFLVLIPLLIGCGENPKSDSETLTVCNGAPEKAFDGELTLAYDGFTQSNGRAYNYPLRLFSAKGDKAGLYRTVFVPLDNQIEKYWNQYKFVLVDESAAKENQTDCLELVLTR